jgi:hypothetical protein
MRFKLFATVFSLLLVQNLWAKRFTSQYCEFELPPGWECALEGTEWVCQSNNKERQKEAIIILAAKIRGPQDSMNEYVKYLKKTKTFSLPGGKTQVSEPKYTKVKTINSHRWVDSLHLASEVPGFYTRYIVTVKEDLGVGVTFSVAKDHYNAYQGLFDKIIETLRVFRQKNVDTSQFKLKKKEEDLLEDSPILSDAGQKFDISKQKRRKGSTPLSATEMGIGALLLIGLLVMMKLKGKKKGKKKVRKKKK